ncbi:MAG: hypothetical protein ABR600_05220 [Actinomycetota bacterium]
MGRGTRAAGTVVVAFVLGGASIVSPASAQDQGQEQTVVTTVAGVHRASTSTGGAGLIAYQADEEFRGSTPAGLLPGTVISRSDHRAALSGTWGDDGFVGSWLYPSGHFQQFAPQTRLLGNAYYANDMSRGATVAGGDRYEFAMGDVVFDSPTPWDRPFSAQPGTLGWASALDVRDIQASTAGGSASVTSLQFRADVVAVGGDVDARAGDVTTPPLLIDLHRLFPTSDVTGWNGEAVTQSPYVDGINFRAMPEAGLIEVRASVFGYIHQASEYTLPSGADVEEWHLPIAGVLTVVTDPSPVLESASVAKIPGATARASLEVVRGAVPRVPSTATVLTPNAEGSFSAGVQSGGGPAAAAPTSSQTIADLASATHVGPSMDTPVDVTGASGTWAVTVDPNYRGQGLLALHSVRRTTLGRTLAETSAIPYAFTDRGAFRLDRSRLIDLRAVPISTSGALSGSIGSGSGPLQYDSTTGMRGEYGALVIDAVYDLGDGVDAFLTFVAMEPAPYELRQGRSFAAAGIIRTIGGEPISGSFQQYLEVPSGTVTFDGTERTTEFAAPLDMNGGHPSLQVGSLTISGSVAVPATDQRPGLDGRVVVQRAPATLEPDAAPDPGVSLEGQDVALTYSSPSLSSTRPLVAGGGGTYPLYWVSPSYTLLPDMVALSFLRSEMPSPPATQAPTPKPIGQPCGTPEITDPAPDAPSDTDIRSAWFDADGAGLSATLQLANVPVAAPAGVRYTYLVTWMWDRITSYAQASVDEAGTWTFEAGFYMPLWSQQMNKIASVTGDVQTGPNGFIRISVPRTLFDAPDGALLRFSGAHSQVTVANVKLPIDDAPDTSHYWDWGYGSDYQLGTC